ncbi:MAG: flagellar hook-associated protein FlgL [Synergistaceae bacterium]|nr:flagellar hook-associated protein FlgL [Synergistaceae bacterium]
MYSRLTTSTMYGSLLSSLQESQRNVQELQKQIATGNKYTSLADNPSAISRSLSIQSALTANAQYQENTNNAITLLRHADSALNNVLDAAQAIRNLVVEASDGALDSSQLRDISDQIEANKKIMLDNLNTKVAGQYIFGGTDTTTRPFVELSDGSIQYQGSDDRIKYALSDSLLGDVNFSGSDIVPTDENTYFICSHYVPIDWVWTGREEKVQITVGNRTLSVFIPEDWQDYDSNKTNSGNVNYSDDNGYRDPNEVSGISLDDLATIINNSLEQQGADMLVHASIEKDYENGVQQMILRSNTGEKIGITGWPDTDYMPMEATLTSLEIDDNTWDKVIYDDSNLGGTSGLMGTTNIVGWHGTTNSGTLTISVNGTDYDFDLSQYTTSTALIDDINSKISGAGDGTPFASMTSGNLSGRFIFQLPNKDDNNNGSIDDSEVNTITVTGTGNALNELFGTSASSITSTSSSLTIKVGDKDASTAKIFINEGDTLEEVADKINAIAGVYSRTSGDGTRLIVTAQRTGQLPDDRLAINEALEALNYPSITITGDGGALNMFTFGTDNAVKAQYTNRILDHSHIDIFDYLGMETAMKSREFNPQNETFTVKQGEQLHWKVMSGGKSVEIKLNPGDYSLDYIADRLKNAGAGWLEVTVSEDKNDDWGRGTLDSEEATQRLVIRGFNGEQVLFLDMNSYNYADKLGLSTALRTDAYTDTAAGTGTKCVNFPSAPCVDDNVGIQLRVQMNCGMTYDVNIKRAEVINPETGFVDRNKVMRAIVDGVNSQAGESIMGYNAHVDSTGSELEDSSAIYFLSGEAFTVVDMPFSDPEWNDYSGGIAAQMGIHGGVTSNLKKTLIPMKDNATFDEAYSDASENFREGTIRFENLGHSVEIDVSADDTVKDIMDRLRIQAGDWLYVNYYDEHMGQDATRNTGDYPLIAISSVDGSAVNIIDVKGHIAQDALGISTGIQGRLNSDGTSNGIMNLEWDIENQTFPATTLEITVAGYSHTIDLTELRDITNDSVIKADDLTEFINARMQDYDVRSEINEDNELVLWSNRGYTVEIKFLDDSGNDITVSDFLGDETLQRTYYRGGYNLEGNSYGTDSRGLDSSSIYDSGIHTQNATIRSGANTAKQNGFGVINDIVAAVNAGNRDDLVEKMIPKIDNFINNILTVMSSNGALQARYNYNNDRLTSENAIMTENYDTLVKIDPADAISQLMVADYMYQANLAIISRLIQPSLLDFLS